MPYARVEFLEQGHSAPSGAPATRAVSFQGPPLPVAEYCPASFWRQIAAAEGAETEH